MAPIDGLNFQKLTVPLPEDSNGLNAGVVEVECRLAKPTELPADQRSLGLLAGRIYCE